MASEESLKVLAPTAILGYGYPLASLQAGMARGVDVIAVDAGSTDPGPYYLGSGKSFTDRNPVKRDLRHILAAGRQADIPVIVGSCGGSGAAPHLAWCRDIVEELVREDGLSFRMGIIHADIGRDAVRVALNEGRISALPNVPPLTENDIEDSVNIVAQIGVEPILKALEAGCRVVLCGRAYDPAAFAAEAIRRGYDRGPALHMGKILECAAIAAHPGSGSDCAMGELLEDCFRL